MLITNIEALGKKRYRICAEEQIVFVLYKSELQRYQLQVQKEMGLETYEEILDTVLLKRAKLRCMNLLKTMDRTEHQLRSKLKQGDYPQSIIDQAVSYVKGYRYIDDERYARQYIEYKKDSKSRRVIVQDLLQKGIENRIIRQAMDESEYENEEELIRRFIKKKKVDLNQASLAELQKLYNFLLRKGFSSSDISKVIRKVQCFDYT